MYQGQFESRESEESAESNNDLLIQLLYPGRVKWAGCWPISKVGFVERFSSDTHTPEVRAESDPCTVRQLLTAEVVANIN